MIICDERGLRCRNCGRQVEMNQKQCSCGTLQPESGFRISAEGGKPPFNGYSIIGFGFACASLFISLYGLTALTGLVLSIVGLVGAKRRGQSGSALAIAGIAAAATVLILRIVLAGAIMWFVDAVYDEFVSSPNWVEEHPFYGLFFTD